MKSRDLLVYLAMKYDGSYESICSALTMREEIDFEHVERMVKTLKCRAVTIVDEDYPASMRTAIKPPFVLFYRGNLDLLHHIDRTISIVGSRNANDYALDFTTKLADELASEGYIIVSGLAKGVDAAALQPAIKYGKAVAFLGNGIDCFYPYCNKDLQLEIGRNGLLISEYPPKSEPNQNRFPERNRLIAAAGNATVITSAALRSGSMITAAFALNAGRDVGCLPARAGEESFCNQLIKEGALLIENKDDVLSLINKHLLQ